MNILYAENSNTLFRGWGTLAQHFVSEQGGNISHAQRREVFSVCALSPV